MTFCSSVKEGYIAIYSPIASIFSYYMYAHEHYNYICNYTYQLAILVNRIIQIHSYNISLALHIT